ncbi:hypothetical protein AVEN_242748-1 [Araneus ventricosus]|uniref:Uncharacterized protein n=1 Tax=Araneus ventricosus TaxID=182803 RepID=A0A4Y2SP51_ARAVE|nr:hypothetical protein AVEN_242748-1 [Araneus ventricosus]
MQPPPPFCRCTTCHRKWAQRATPPLLCHRVDESLLTYTAASHPPPDKEVQGVLLLDRQTQRHVGRHQEEQKLQCNMVSQTTFRGRKSQKTHGISKEEDWTRGRPLLGLHVSQILIRVTFSYGVTLTYSFMRRLWTHRRIS